MLTQRVGDAACQSGLHGTESGENLASRPAFVHRLIPMEPPPIALCLASASPTRSALLTAAGVPHSVAPARIDEPALIASLGAEGANPREIAVTLAGIKAARVSTKHPGILTLGCDQTLDFNGAVLNKPPNTAAARAQLQALRGQRHQLHAAAVITLDGAELWRHIGSATLQMRSFSESFLDRYLADQGDDLLATVGAYRLEAEGVQLFSTVSGDYFSILGLPLLPVLGFLRARGVLPE